MASDEGRDFAGARVDDADFSGARLHSPNFEGTRITDGWLGTADISGDIQGLRVNGVEVAPLVDAELDRRFPQRAKLRANDPQGLADAWAMLEDLWRTTDARARALPESLLFERVDDEWSFVETLRHLVLATDCWLLRMVRQISRPYHPWGVAGSWLKDPGRPQRRGRGRLVSGHQSSRKESFGTRVATPPHLRGYLVRDCLKLC